MGFFVRKDTIDLEYLRFYQKLQDIYDRKTTKEDICLDVRRRMREEYEFRMGNDQSYGIWTSLTQVHILGIHMPEICLGWTLLEIVEVRAPWQILVTFLMNFEKWKVRPGSFMAALCQRKKGE